MTTRWAPIFGVYAAIVVAFSSVVIGFIVSAALVGPAGGAREILVSVVITAVILSGWAFVFTVRAGSLSSAARRLRLRSVDPLSVLITIAGVLGTSFFLDGVIGLFGLDDVGALANLRDTLGALGGLEKIGAALIIGLGPGLGEELFFRGFVLGRLGALSGPWHGLIASSIAFGLAHMDPVQSPAAILLGLYLGVSVLLTGSLWTGIIAHTINNVAATFMALVELDALRGAILMVAGSVASVCGIFLLRQRRGAL